MRALALCLGIGIVLTAACGGSSSGSKSPNANGRDPKTGYCTVSASGESCAGVAAFDACAASSCDAQAKAALGNSYASGSFSGPCRDYMNCMLACPCDTTASACETNCLAVAAANASCATPGLALQACIASSCGAPVCSSGTGTGTSTGTSAGGSTCAQAQACCTSLSALAGASVAALQAACAQMASYTETQCSQAIAAIQAAGYCK
jgi:hypothetical protein